MLSPPLRAQNGQPGRNPDSCRQGDTLTLTFENPCGFSEENISDERVAMTAVAIPDLADLKARQKATWMAGNYERIAELTAVAAVEFVARRHVEPGMRVLDVACGTGNLAIPAAKAGAAVTGVDIAPNLLDAARRRAAREGVTVELDPGDAEDLPYPDGAFDLVLSMYGAMFAPQPERVAAELLRVCRPGGRIAMANWTPGGFIGRLFAVTGKHVAAPAGVPSPLLWGDDATVRDRFRSGATEMATARLIARLEFPLPISETIEFYRVNYGPTSRAFAALSDAAQAAFRKDLEDLYSRHNEAADHATSIAAEYLEVVATRG
jgi:2-polyprenyl-3-methyl-5-hydroxy-6-metoxy-1,4-benzoquinol methylase